MEKNPDSADTNPWRYCGEYWDGETETYYLRARNYNPRTGRFTQEDTYRGDPKDPLSLNLYTYCYNDPIKYQDSTGRSPELIMQAEQVAQELIWLDGPLPFGDLAAAGVLVFVGGVWVWDQLSEDPPVYGAGRRESSAETIVLDYRLPSWEKVKLDMDHILSGHSAGGNRGGPNKSRFPDWMSDALIIKAIEEAYKAAEKAGAQQFSWREGIEHVTQFFRGQWGDQEIEFWFNFTTNTIESAWPKW